MTAFLLFSKEQSNIFWMLQLLLSFAEMLSKTKYRVLDPLRLWKKKKSEKVFTSTFLTPLLTDKPWPVEQVGNTTEKGRQVTLSWQDSNVTVTSEIHAHIYPDYRHPSTKCLVWLHLTGAGGSIMSTQEQGRLSGCFSADSVPSLSPKCQQKLQLTGKLQRGCAFLQYRINE